MKKQIVSLVLCAVTLVAMATGCGKSASDQEKEVESIDFMYWNNGSDTEDTKAIEEIIKKYEQETGIEVNEIVVPDAKYYETLDTRIAGNQAPDLIRVKYQVMGKYIQAGTFEELDEYLPSDMKSNMMEAFSAAVQKEGKYYAVPWHTDTNAILYNKKYFEQAGVEAPSKIEDAWTWEEFLDTAKTLQEKSDAKYGFGIRWFNNASYRVLPFLYMNGGQMVNDEYTKGCMSDPKSIEFLDYIKSWNDEGIIPNISPNSSENHDDLFINGTTAMSITGNYMMAAFDTQMKDDYGVTFMPQVDGKTSSDLGGSGLAVNSKSEKKQEAINLLISFIEKENMAYFCGKAGFLPVRNDISVDDLNYESNSDKMEIFIEQVSRMDKKMAELETSSNFAEMGRLLSDSIEKLMLEDITSKELAKEMDSKIEDILK